MAFSFFLIGDRDGGNDYFYRMTITCQTVVDENGKPTAAQIPWEQFELLQQKLEEVDLSRWKSPTRCVHCANR